MQIRRPIDIFRQQILNESGFIAVFIAIIFQVLFVFFAMIINLGLLVHDKINLQNSVDLAAYYAAQRQAEVLNVIAHSNYQIRQSYKLLAFRARVLGDMGNDKHPILDGNTGAGAGGVLSYPEAPKMGKPPFVCTNYALWERLSEDGKKLIINQDMNNCREKAKAVKFPDPPPVIYPLNPLNLVANILTQQLGDEFSKQCNGAGPHAWRMAVRWMGAYKQDIATRTEIIENFRDALSASDKDFKDVENGSAFEGVVKTIEKNLTRSNLENVEVELYNSLGHEAVKDKWLRKITISPQLYYLDFKASDGTCTTKIVPCSTVPDAISTSSAAGIGANFAAYCGEPEDSSSPVRSTIGYEKNPWALAYVGVEARVKGRRPFAPFGRQVELVARAYAKPFGGSVGPWLFARWSRASVQSDSGPLVDKLLALSDSDSDSLTAGDGSENRVPNYSRFPGDNLGLRSQRALAITKKAFIQDIKKRLNESMWGALPENFKNEPSGDILAWEGTLNQQTGAFQPLPDGGGPEGPFIRPFELAAVSPDLFDISYYSIEPQFEQNYVQRAKSIFSDPNLQPRPDIGFRENTTVYGQMNVEGQVDYVLQKAQLLGAPWLVQAAEHVLTWWAPNQLGKTDFDYEFPESVFGKCTDGKLRPSGRQIPGGCVAGGRTGYSVKLVSEDFIISNEAASDGGSTRGPILNPPPF